MHATGDTEILRTWEAGSRMAVSMRVQSGEEWEDGLVARAVNRQIVLQVVITPI